jgi:hypothetical protein
MRVERADVLREDRDGERRFRLGVGHPGERQAAGQETGGKQSEHLAHPQYGSI